MSIVLYTIVNFLSSFEKQEFIKKKETVAIMEMESLRLYLQKKVFKDKNLDNLTFDGDKLYYKYNLLLDDVGSFEKIVERNFITLKLCIKNHILCQTIILQKNN